MIKEMIKKLGQRADLTRGEMEAVFGEIMGGEAAHEDMKAFLILLADKGETVDEITAAAAVMREKMARVSLPYETVLDTCGTGGGGADSFNVSTMSAVIAAACGARVAKHGNRSYTRHCGSADILERLGVEIDITPTKVAECIKEVGVGFIYAPLYHSAMKHVVPVRGQIKRRTIFNILGPLSNPAGANAQVLGVFDRSLTEPLARVLKNLGSVRVFAVYGLDDFDEFSVSDESVVSELKDGAVRTYNVEPEDFGINRAGKGDVKCATLEENIQAFESILRGEKGAKRDMALVNTGAALVAAGLAHSFKEGAALAARAIDSGGARKTLDALVEFTSR